MCYDPAESKDNRYKTRPIMQGVTNTRRMIVPQPRHSYVCHLYTALPLPFPLSRHAIIASKSLAILGKSNLDIKGGRVCSSSPLPTKLAMHIQDKINLISINAKIIITYDRFTGSETIWRQ